MTVDDRDVLVIRDGDRYYALSNVCAHQHLSKLHLGRRTGMIVECPMHGWQYDIRTGASVNGCGALAVYTVELRDGEVCLLLPEDA